MHAVWIVALWLAGAGADKTPVELTPRVRATHGAERVVGETAARSATVRELIGRLATTDVIVYVEITGAPDVPTARTKLVTATPLARFLRIGISAAMPMSDWPAYLAHELQHAVEIAEHADVRDDAGVRRLYAAIGRESGMNAYETAAALQVERRVRDELRHSGRQ